MTTIRSERPSCAWVSPSDINGRIDAVFFHCHYIPLDDALAHFPRPEVKTLGQLLSNPRRVLYQKTTSYAAEEAPDGSIPFISGVDLDGRLMTVDWASVRHVERWMIERYPKGRLTDGSLLIKVKGPNQHTAFITKADRVALVSGTVFFSGVRDCNPHYLAAYLSSGPGTAWRSRLRTNTTVEFIGNGELRAVPILTPSAPLQHHIGEKVRLAELCRAEADRYWKTAYDALGDAIGTSLDPSTFEPKTPESVSAPGYAVASVAPAVARVAPRRIQGYIGAQFFHPRRAKALLVIERSGLRTKRLAELAVRFSRRVGADEMVRLSLPYVGLAQIDPTTGFISQEGEEKPTGNSARFGAGDILFSKLRPYLNKVAICPDHIQHAAGSTELVTYRAREGVDPHTLFFILKSPLVLNQVIKITSGSTHPRVAPDLIDDVAIPLVPSDARDAISSSTRSALALLHRATQLVAEAKTDVEALIEGTLDTDAIIAGRLKPPTAEEVLGA